MESIQASPLPAHASTIVIGGGIMGCSTLYHLAKFSDKDAILLERQQLTSGTTWHSAAQVRQLRSTKNLTRLVQYSAQLYAELEQETGQSTGWLKTGSLSIATNPDRLTHIRRQAALAKAYGVVAEEIDVSEVKRLWPLINTDDIIGAVFSPDDGRVNPSDLCLALSKGARARGARIFENTLVSGFIIENNHICGVQTPAGVIRCEQVVLCTGLWSRALAQQVGGIAPLLPCEHFYLLTKPITGIDAHLPSLSDHDAHLYIRDDVGGLLVGCFEPKGKPIDPKNLSENFAFTLFDEDWDHFEPMLLNAIHRIPALQNAEARMLLNGPESFTTDGSFLLGESAEVSGLFYGCGMNSVGIATGGGSGWALAQWLVDGHAPFHLDEAEPNRFHPLENNINVLLERAPEVLGRHYEITYPGRQFESARYLRKTPLHEGWVQEKAHFAQVFAWERPLYFNCDKAPPLTFGEPAWFEQVAQEVTQAHQAAALFDQSTFGKIRVSGSDAEVFLQRVCANNMARTPGQVIYTAMLNGHGGFESDFTAFRINDEEYLLYVGTSAIRRDLAWLRRHLYQGERVSLADVTEEYAVLALMGPKAQQIMSELGGADLLDLGYFRHTEIELAGIRLRAARLSYVGEAGWELTCAANDAMKLYQVLKQHGAQPAGAYAQTSMRIEKRFLAMGHDLDSDITPLEDWFGFCDCLGHRFHRA